MSTTKTSTARALLDPEVKKQAEAILKELGTPGRVRAKDFLQLKNCLMILESKKHEIHQA